MPRKRKKHRKATNTTKGSDNRFLRPTDERGGHNAFESAGAAMRVIPPITLLRKNKLLTEDEYEALLHYREQSQTAEQSLIRSSCNFEPFAGAGNGPGVSIQSAKIELDRMNRDLRDCFGKGTLDVVRQIAGNDWTPEQWCEERLGASGVSEQSVALVVLELKFAAGGITIRE